MRDRSGLNLCRCYELVSFVGDKEPGILQQRHGSADRAANSVEIKIGIGVLGLECRGREIGLTFLIIQGPCRQGRILVVIERRTVIIGTATFRTNSNICYTRVLRAEVRRKKINLADRFERRLAGGGLSENTPVRTLAVQRKAGAIALGTDELERAVRSALRHIRVQIQERVHAPAIPRKFDDLQTVECLANGLI